jgi:hypothetical protein
MAPSLSAPTRAARCLTGVLYAGPALLAAAYICHLPTTVQALDSGELVAAAWTWTVPHPPGYPLYLWLYGAAVHDLPWGTVFWRAALTTVVAAWAVLVGAQQRSGNTLSGFLAIVLPLGLQPIFWHYALVPDVFMLNAAFFVAVASLHFKGPPTPRRTYGMAVLFGLGLSHQHTLLFALPLLASAVWGCPRKRRLRVAFATSVLVLCPMAILYGSLLWMHPEALHAWGNLQNCADLWRHVIRADYGTFRLSAAGPTVAPLHNIGLWARDCLSSLPVACGILIWGLVRRHHLPGDTLKALRIYAVAGACYIIVFFACANTNHADVLARFFVLPHVWVSLGAAQVWASLANCNQQKIVPWARTALTAVAVGVACMPQDRQHQRRDLSAETIVEDYAVNLLRELPTSPPPLLVVHGDTRMHAVRYAQAVLDVRPEVPVLSRSAFTPGLGTKLRARWPALKLPAIAPQTSPGAFLNALYKDNVGHFSIAFTSTRDMDLSQAQTIVRSVGRQLIPGHGYAVDAAAYSAAQRRSDSGGWTPSSVVHEELDLFAAYAYPDLIAASLAEAAHDEAAAQAAYARALALVPYCLPAAHALCLRAHGGNVQLCDAMAFAYRAEFMDYFE